MAEHTPETRPEEKDFLTTEEGKSLLSKLFTEEKPASAPVAGATPEKPVEKPALKLVKLETESGVFEVPEPVANGYWRQADYTRKTQELSRQRQDISGRKYKLDEFEKDPKAWIERYHPELAKPATATGEPSRTEEASTDPGERALKEVLDFKHEAKVQDEERRIESECQALSEKYPEEFNRVEILDYCLKNNLSSPALAFKDLRFDSIDRRYQAQVERLAEKRVAEILASRGSVAAGEPADKTAGISVSTDAIPKTDREAREQALNYALKAGLYK